MAKKVKRAKSVTTKGHYSKSHDLFYVSLIVLVIVGAIMVIFTGSLQTKSAKASVQGAKVVREVTKEEMLESLQNTVDDSSGADFNQLKKEASGL